MNDFLIEFDKSLGMWSPFIYWFVLINTVLCAAFTVVVVVGGLFDLRFLFRALREEVVDEQDDGRVDSAPSEQPSMNQ